MSPLLYKNILVTGATGFIGSALARRLLHEGGRVRVLARDRRRLAADILAGSEVFVGGLSDNSVIRDAVNGADVVFHCAANVNTWDTWNNYQDVNVQGLTNLLNAMDSKNQALSHLVFVSSADVYGFPVRACDESAVMDGRPFGYGVSKVMGENLIVQESKRSGLGYTILRPCNVIGPNSQFVKRIGHELRSGLMLTISGGASNAGLVYIDNLIDVLLWSATAPEARNQSFNVRDQYDVTWAQFIREFRKRLKGRGIVMDLPFSVAMAAAKILGQLHRWIAPDREPLLHPLLVNIFGRTCGHSSEKIHAASGISSLVGFHEAMERSSTWYLQHLEDVAL